MGNKQWTTLAQQVWLESEIPAFLKARREIRLDHFFQGLEAKWFKEYPEIDSKFPRVNPTGPRPPLTSDERRALSKALAKRKTQLESWMHWHTGKDKRASQKLNLKAYDVAFTAKKRGRAPQVVEVYQKLFAERLAPKIQEEIQLRKAKTRSELMAARRSVVMKMFESEDEETRHVVSAEVERIKGIKKEEDEDPDSDGADDTPSPKRSPLEYHKAVKKLPEYLSHHLQLAAEATGWVIFVAAAGPNPSADGDIYMEQYCFGPKLNDGQTFLDAYSTALEEGFRKPFGVFVNDAIPREERLQHALSSSPSPVPPTVDPLHLYPIDPISPSSQVIPGTPPQPVLVHPAAPCASVMPPRLSPRKQRFYNASLGQEDLTPIIPPRISPRKHPYRSRDTSPQLSLDTLGTDFDPNSDGVDTDFSSSSDGFDWANWEPSVNNSIQKMDTYFAQGPAAPQASQANPSFSDDLGLYSTTSLSASPAVNNSWIPLPHYNFMPHAIEGDRPQPMFQLPSNNLFINGASSPTSYTKLMDTSTPFASQPVSLTLNTPQSPLNPSPPVSNAIEHPEPAKIAQPLVSPTRAAAFSFTSNAAPFPPTDQSIHHPSPTQNTLGTAATAAPPIPNTAVSVGSTIAQPLVSSTRAAAFPSMFDAAPFPPTDQPTHHPSPTQNTLGIAATTAPPIPNTTVNVGLTTQSTHYPPPDNTTNTPVTTAPSTPNATKAGSVTAPPPSSNSPTSAALLMLQTSQDQPLSQNYHIPGVTVSAELADVPTQLPRPKPRPKPKKSAPVRKRQKPIEETPIVGEGAGSTGEMDANSNETPNPTPKPKKKPAQRPKPTREIPTAAGAGKTVGKGKGPDTDGADERDASLATRRSRRQIIPPARPDGTPMSTLTKSKKRWYTTRTAKGICALEYTYKLVAYQKGLVRHTLEEQGPACSRSEESCILEKVSEGASLTLEEQRPACGGSEEFCILEKVLYTTGMESRRLFLLEFSRP
ncbi:hypothetical protein BD779DRAFT_1481637 [Infundibulicybe gibba]|nr:hypothetical protein BD779DRAFT_1481637 [Infundibulicybe gibba]